MVKVAVINDRPHRLYGMQRTTIEMAEILHEAGHDVLYVCLGNGPVIAECERRGLPVTGLGVGDAVRTFDANTTWGSASAATRTIRDWAGATRSLIALLRRRSIRTVIFATNRVAMLAPLLRLFGIRSIVYGQNTIPLGWRAVPVVVGASALPQMSPRCVDAYPASLRRVFPEKFPLLPLGIDVGEFVSLPPSRSAEGCRLVSIAKISERKGTGQLIEAVRTLRRDGLDVSLALVGDAGSTRDEHLLAELMEETADEHFVNWVGFVEDIVPELRTADIGVIASVEEGGPRVLFEMMAAGLPVVSTDVGYTREVLEGSGAGVIIDSNDPDVLAEALRPLIVDAQAVAAMGERARQVAGSNYTVDVFADELVTMLEAEAVRA